MDRVYVNDGNGIVRKDGQLKGSTDHFLIFRTKEGITQLFPFVQVIRVELEADSLARLRFAGDLK
jgi:hypothetical protein